MITITKNLERGKLVKRVEVSEFTEGLNYIAFLFPPADSKRGNFRIIYNNTPGRSRSFTAWKLDKSTGIWGCFADELDIGFDYEAVLLEKDPEPERLKDDEANPISLEIQNAREKEIQDAVCAVFFDMMLEHISQLFFCLA